MNNTTLFNNMKCLTNLESLDLSGNYLCQEIDQLCDFLINITQLKKLCLNSISI